MSTRNSYDYIYIHRNYAERNVRIHLVANGGSLWIASQSNHHSIRWLFICVSQGQYRLHTPKNHDPSVALRVSKRLHSESIVRSSLIMNKILHYNHHCCIIYNKMVKNIILIQIFTGNVIQKILLLIRWNLYFYGFHFEAFF